MRVLALCFSILILTSGCRDTAEDTSVDPVPNTTRPAEVADGDHAVPTLVAISIGAIPNLTRAGDLYLAGQPTEADLHALRTEGITRFITLRHAEELGNYDQAGAVGAAGMQYTTLPWNGPDQLTDDVFDAVRDVLSANEGPAILQCRSANRVGAVWLPYRVLDQGVDLEQAVMEARRVGMGSPAYEALAREYIARRAN
jgi:uncharacterized protein (TIGR01244 family)